MNVGNGAQITGAATSSAGAASISVNDGSTVNNLGTITPTVTTATPGVGVNLNGSNTTLINGTTGSINVANNPTTAGSTATTLYGVITTSGTSFSNVNVKNYGSIAVTQNLATSSAYGIYPGENIDSVRIDNYGTISITRNAGAISTTRVGAIGSDDDTDEMRVVNHAGGVVTASGINTFAVGARAADFTFINAGTVSALTTNARGAIVIYGGDPDDGTSATARIVNDKKGVINGNVTITDNTPFAAAAGAGNIGAVATNTTQTRDSTFNNKGTVNGSFTYGTGTHVLANTGSISGSIYVLQTAAVGIGGGSFTLRNKGTLGGDIRITDRADSVNAVTLNGTGFSGNVVAVNGTGNNTLTLRDVTNLASVQNFTNLNLQRSNVTVANGVSLVSGANIGTTIFGPGGTRAAPSTNLGSMTGTLTLAGPTTVTPEIKSLVRNGNVYQVASAVTGPGAGAVTVNNSSALVKTSADTSDGRLLLTTQVRNANSISGLSQPAAATLGGLLNYNGHNQKVLALGGAIESFDTLGAVRQAANALAPITNGADIQSVINSTMLIHQQIDGRLDSFLYAQLPSTGRSADLGPSHPVPVYGALPANGAWAEGIGGDVHQGAAAGVNGYGATLTGVIGGYDRLIIPGLRVGGAFGYIDTDVNGNSNFIGARETIQTYQGLGYVAWEAPRYYLRASAGDGGVDFKSVRAIQFPGFSDSAVGQHGGNVFTARGEGGLPVEYWGKLFVPYAAFSYSRLDQSAYTEASANGAGLAYRSAQNDSERSEVGGKIVVPLGDTPIFAKLLRGDAIVAVEARAAYVHEFGNVAQTVSASFVGGGNVFVASGPVPNRDMVDYGIGLRIGSPRVQIDASYNGLARSTFYQQVGLLRARYLF